MSDDPYQTVREECVEGAEGPMCPQCAEYDLPLIRLPAFVGLCPTHGEDFYMPLTVEEIGRESALTCPQCLCRMVVYERRA